MSITIRARFTKTGDSSYISLLDLQRVMQRALKRSGLPAWYTLGFNPHIYMTFAAPLALGQESLCECVDFKTEAEDYDWSDAPARLSACLPRGIEVVSVAPAKTKPEIIEFSRYRLHYSAAHAEEAAQALAAYAALPEALVLKKGKHKTEKQIDLKQLLRVGTVQSTEDGGADVALLAPAGNTLTVNPALLLGYLEANLALPATAADILRVQLLTKTEELFC